MKTGIEAFSSSGRNILQGVWIESYGQMKMAGSMLLTEIHRISGPFQSSGDLPFKLRTNVLGILTMQRNQAARETPLIAQNSVSFYVS